MDMTNFTDGTLFDNIQKINEEKQKRMERALRFGVETNDMLKAKKQERMARFNAEN